MTKSEKLEIVGKIACLTAVIIYIALRFWRLTDSCLWFDEIFSVHAAEHAWKDLFWFVAQDLIHPPLFYVLLKIWILVGGESLSWLRFFPVFFSIIALVPFGLLCRELKLNLPTIALALTFLAVNGALIKYAQEVRMYSVLLCFALFSMWLFRRFFNDKKGLLALILINILLVYTHYFGWLVVVTEVLAIGLLKREKLKQMFVMFAVTLISFLPWIYAVWQATQVNSNFSQNLGWASKPNFSTLFQFVFDLFEPIYFQQSSADANAIFLVTLPIVLFIAFAIGNYFWNLREENADDKRRFYLLLIFIKIPILLAFAASWLLPYSIWGTRHLIIVFAPLAILTAIALTEIKFWQLKTASLIVIFMLFGAAFALQARQPSPNFIWCAWENLAQDLRTQNEPTKIYVFEDLVAYHFWFALRESDKMQIIAVKGITGLDEDAAYFLPRGFTAVKTTDENGIEGERFFIAFRDEKWNSAKPPLMNLLIKGYKIGEPKAIEAQGLKAFLVEIKKENN